MVQSNKSDFLNWSFWSIDGILSSTTTSDQSGTGNNTNKQVPHIFLSSLELKPYYLMQFSFVSRTHSFFGGVEVSPLNKGYNLCIHSRTDTASLFNDTSTLYGLFNAEIWFIWKCFINITTIFSLFHCNHFFRSHFFNGLQQSFICTHLCGIKYSYLILIICIYLWGSAEKFIGWLKYIHGMLLNRSTFGPHTSCFLELLCLNLIGQKRNQQQIWRHQINF